jgi:hypothetical protein
MNDELYNSGFLLISPSLFGQNILFRTVFSLSIYIKVKIKQSRYRPGVAQRF